MCPIIKNGSSQPAATLGKRTALNVAHFTEQARRCLTGGKQAEVGALLDSNFDKRRSIYRLGQSNITMVELARSAGASAKFCGSGGAIVGTYTDEAMFERLEKVLSAEGIRVIRPEVV